MPEEPLETALAPKFKQVEAFFEKNKFVLGERVCVFRIVSIVQMVSKIPINC